MVYRFCPNIQKESRFEIEDIAHLSDISNLISLMIYADDEVITTGSLACLKKFVHIVHLNFSLVA